VPVTTSNALLRWSNIGQSLVGHAFRRSHIERRTASRKIPIIDPALYRERRSIFFLVVYGYRKREWFTAQKGYGFIQPRTGSRKPKMTYLFVIAWIDE
jgi:hypothetical protein